MPTIPDSSVVLDLLQSQQGWHAWSGTWFKRCAREDDLIINAVIFAESTARMVSYDNARLALAALGLFYEDIPEIAAHAAGQAHQDYRRRGGERVRTLPDFLIGAHAFASGYRLLTRDASRFRSYFPDLDIIAPDTHP